jgi:hypothetical protein
VAEIYLFLSAVSTTLASEYVIGIFGYKVKQLRTFIQIGLFRGGAKFLCKSNLVRLNVFYAAFTPSPQKKQIVLSPHFSLICIHLEDMDVTKLHTTSCMAMNKSLQIRNKCHLELYDMSVDILTVADCCLVYS